MDSAHDFKHNFPYKVKRTAKRLSFLEKVFLSYGAPLEPFDARAYLDALV